ncbi:M48 family metallopeptidase [Alicyclobacillus vulcanalis]|nr:SprT family zinc-dependent metalloprotease [Alicyclobacillus vulcanalis]
MRLRTICGPDGEIAAYEMTMDTTRVLIRVRTGRRTQKRIVLRADDGGLSVSAPPFARPKDVADVIAQNWRWIKEAHDRIQASKPKRLRIGDEVVLLGHPYVIASREAGEAALDEGQSTLWIPADQDNVHVRVCTWARAFAREYLTSRAAHWIETTGLSPSYVGVKSQKSRWGSCSSQRRIHLNWRLIHAPVPVVDYVIVHELAHLVHMHHGPAFWQLVERWLPDWQAQRAWLRLHGSELFVLDENADA